MNKRKCYNSTDAGQSFGLAVAVMVVAQFSLSLAFTVLFGESSGDGTVSLPDWAFWLMQALYTVIIGSVALIYAAVTKTNFVSATTLDKKPKLDHVGWGCLAGLFLIALMLPVNDMFLTLIEKMGFSRPSVDMPMQVVPMLIIACLLPSFTEEIVFRGTIAISLRDSPNRWGSLALGGALFAIFHLNPAQTLHQFVLGAFLMLLLLRSGSVWTTCLVHFFNNAVAVVLSFTVTDETLFTKYWWAFILVGLTGFVGCVFGYLKTTQSCWTTDIKNSQPTIESSRRRSNVFLFVALAVCTAMWFVNLAVS